MTRYQFTFARHPYGCEPELLLAHPGAERPALVQRVYLNASTSRDAWALFEALYPPKRFTAFGLQVLRTRRALPGLRP